jgi:hypothetical protein
VLGNVDIKKKPRKGLKLAFLYVTKMIEAFDYNFYDSFSVCAVNVSGI